VGSYDDLKSPIESSKGPFAIFECVCRKGAEARGEPCKKTSRKETCFAMGPQVIAGGDNENFHIISKAEALEILRMNEEDGLVLQPATAVNPHFICSCCGDCCGMLRLQKAVPKPTDFWFSNYYAEVDSDLCSGCGTCVDRCQVDAMTLDEEIGISNVNLDRCIGCGNCVPTCPDEAITLIKKDKGEDLVPPADYAEMIEIIMTDKKSKKT
jgi:ferredoxin